MQFRYPLGIAEIDPQRNHRGIGTALFEIIDIFVLDLAGHPVFNLVRFENFRHLLRSITDSVQTRDNRTHRGTRHVIDRNAVLFQRFDHADVVESFGAPAAQHESHTLGRRQRGREQQDQRNYASEVGHLQNKFLTLSVK